MDNGFFEFGFRQAIVLGADKVCAVLFGADTGDQTGNGDQGVVTRRQFGKLPPVSLEDVIGEVYEFGSEVVDE